MPAVIEIVMMSVATIMLMLTRVKVDEIPKTATLRAGMVAVIGIFGLAWLGDSFIAAHKEVIVPAIGHLAEVAPWTFAFGLFFASVLAGTLDVLIRLEHPPRSDRALLSLLTGEISRRVRLLGAARRYCPLTTCPSTVSCSLASDGSAALWLSLIHI